MMRLAVLTALAACTSGEDTSEPTTTTTVDGRDVFAQTCAVCHGVDGLGGTGPDLTTVLPGMSAAEVEDVLRNGSGDMPAQTTLSDAEITAVIDYVLAEFG